MSKKNLKLIFSLCFFLGLMNSIYSQELPKFQIGIKGDFLVGDSDLNSSYDVLAGLDAKYFIKQGTKFHHFVNAGILSDVGVSEANLFGINLGIGTQYDLLKIKNKPLYLELGVGGLYTSEKFSTQLIDRTVDTTVSEVDFMANFGIGYRWSERINTQLNLTQIGSKGTSIGLGVSYSFN